MTFYDYGSRLPQAIFTAVLMLSVGGPLMVVGFRDDEWWLMAIAALPTTLGILLFTLIGRHLWGRIGR